MDSVKRQGKHVSTCEQINLDFNFIESSRPLLSHLNGFSGEKRKPENLPLFPLYWDEAKGKSGFMCTKGLLPFR